MSDNSPYSTIDEKKLMTHIWSPEIADDPEAFVRFIFPWGQRGTPLADKLGPKKWQTEELRNIKLHIQENKKLISQNKMPKIYKSATVSGRGVGKSTLVAWLNYWFMSTRIGGSSIVSANTEAQLKSVTWAELGKWHALAINSHWFEKQAMSLKPSEWLQKALTGSMKIDSTYYYANAKLWAEENPESFAGLHNMNGEMYIFDEASGIPQNIWEVVEGVFVIPILHRYWFAFSNGRRNTGAFFECFYAQRDQWNRRHLDSRNVEGTDLDYLNSIIKKHGEDSDVARIEVKGEFPRQGDRQFISREVVQEAAARELQSDSFAGLMMGVDPARFGDDSTVIRFRQGRDARSIPPVKLKGKDNMYVANVCAELIQKYNPDAVCIDAGNGTGIIDRLRELKFKVHEVWFGGKADEQEWVNKRTELWARLREWLKGGCIDNDEDLITDIASPEYKFMGASDKIMLESKEDMKKRGFDSPDDADALACTFAVKVASSNLKTSRLGGNFKTRLAKGMDYNVFGD